MLKEFTFDNVDNFYRMCTTNDSVNNSGSRQENHLQEEDRGFRGLTLEKIKASKYSYTEGLDKLEEIDAAAPQIGGCRNSYKWSEDDGDEFSYERMIDGFAPIKQHLRNMKGVKTGKVIDIYINIAENCTVSYDKFLQKAHTAMRLVDFLESYGFRVGIYSCAYSEGTGEMTDKNGKTTNVDAYVKVCVKKPEDPLMKGFILNAISPWFFRYWIFGFLMGNIKSNWYLGRAEPLGKKTTRTEIYIDTGECLDKTSSEKKIKEVLNLFEDDSVEQNL